MIVQTMKTFLSCTRTLTGNADGITEKRALYKKSQMCITSLPHASFFAMAGADGTFSGPASSSTSSISSGASTAIIIVACLVAIAILVITIMLVFNIRIPGKGKIVETV